MNIAITVGRAAKQAHHSSRRSTTIERAGQQAATDLAALFVVDGRCFISITPPHLICYHFFYYSLQSCISTSNRVDSIMNYQYDALAASVKLKDVTSCAEKGHSYTVLRTTTPA
eukprot:scaffold3554_cov83-Skeletonema_marinoi.AAC.4